MRESLFSQDYAILCHLLLSQQTISSKCRIYPPSPTPLSRPIHQRSRINHLNPQLIHTLLPPIQNLKPFNLLPLALQLVKHQQLAHPIHFTTPPQLAIQNQQSQQFLHLIVCDADFTGQKGQFDSFVGTDDLDDDLVADGTEDGVDVGADKGVGEDVFCVALEDFLEEGDVFLLVGCDEVCHCLDLGVVFVTIISGVYK